MVPILVRSMDRLEPICWQTGYLKLWTKIEQSVQTFFIVNERRRRELFFKWYDRELEIALAKEFIRRILGQI